MTEFYVNGIEYRFYELIQGYHIADFYGTVLFHLEHDGIESWEYSGENIKGSVRENMFQGEHTPLDIAQWIIATEENLNE